MRRTGSRRVGERIDRWDPDSAPILVIGAGPTGLTMACELARRGRAVRVVDVLPDFLPTSRATGIHSRTLEILDDMGIVDAFVAQGQPVVGILRLRIPRGTRSPRGVVIERLVSERWLLLDDEKDSP